MTFADDVLKTLTAHEREAISAFLESTKSDAAGACSDGALDVPDLVRMLLQDIALAVHRPGSWEGANMRQVLESHGYTALGEHERCIRARRAYWNGKDPYAGKP